ncbi:MAG: site-2 protease family protein [Firmicutes bacterium]|nr:site-2 protease family protein [Bacillota bacterium]
MIFGGFDLQWMLFGLPAIIIALTFHEFSHGLAAYLLGDKTAKRDGRLSFNPIRHIDPVGLIMMLLFRFGWAKPVMVNPYNLKNPKQDMAIISVAGPLSNFILAFITMIILVFFIHAFGMRGGTAVNNIATFLSVLVQINVVLGVFNMLPIPPLDGSKIFGFILPDHLYFRYIGFRYGMFVLMGLVLFGLVGIIMGPFIMAIINAFYSAASQIYVFFM